MKIRITTFAGHKLDMLIRPFVELVIGREGIVKNNPTVRHQLQVVEERTVVLPGFRNPIKLGYATEGTNERMYFDTSFFLRQLGGYDLRRARFHRIIES